jgi:hypothetical protein
MVGAVNRILGCMKFLWLRGIVGSPYREVWQMDKSKRRHGTTARPCLP